MVERGEGLAESTELINRLQAELQFAPDESGEWLINDELEYTSGVNGNEFIPSRVRVSNDGTRLEFGVFKEDLEKNLELARITGQNAKDLEFIRNFWPEEHVISCTEDEEVIYFGVSVDSSIEDFETKYHRTNYALSTVIEAGARGIDYLEAMNEENMLYPLVRDIEDIKNASRSEIFDNKSIEELVNSDESIETSSRRDYWDRAAENLRAYRIETWEKFVGNANTEFRIGGKVYIGSGIGHLAAHNGSEIVSIHDNGYLSGDVYSGIQDDTRKIGKDWSLELPIPEGVEISTVQDITKLTKAKLILRDDIWMQPRGSSEEIELSMEVSVDDHELTLKSEDGKYEIKFYEPKCDRCETPIWKFEWPEGSEEERLSNSAGMGFGSTGDIIIESTYSSGGGIYSYGVGRYKRGNRRSMYCKGCFDVVSEEFAVEFPYTRRENALTAVRAALDENGYTDVKLEPTQVWPTFFDSENEIEIFAFVEYERNGRKIMRRAGDPRITYDGKVTLNMPSREYLEFR